jgi:hypothetical protein
MIARRGREIRAGRGGVGVGRGVVGGGERERRESEQRAHDEQQRTPPPCPWQPRGSARSRLRTHSASAIVGARRTREVSGEGLWLR